MFKKILSLALLCLICFGLYLNRGSIFPQKNKNELLFWTIQLKPVCEEIIQKNIDSFERKYPHIKVVWVDIPIAEAQKRTLASILGNTPPDIVNLNPDFSMLLAQRGALEFFDETELKNFHPELVNALKYNNQVFGVPYYATSSVTLYNKKLYDACSDKPFVKTYHDLAKMSPELYSCQSRLSKNNSTNSIFTLNLNENDTLARVLSKYDVTDFKNPQQTKNTQEIFNLFKTMYDKGYIPKDSLTINHREVVEKYMAPNTMVVVVGANFIKMVEENSQDVYKDSAVAPQLVGSNGKYDVALMNFVIPKKAPHKELAKEFVLELTSKENQLEFAKLTNVLPANTEALDDPYFNVCNGSDLISLARCESKKQLDNLISKNFGYKNKKAINDTLNRTLESYILEGAKQEKIDKMATEVNMLQE